MRIIASILIESDYEIEDVINKVKELNKLK